MNLNTNNDRSTNTKKREHQNNLDAPEPIDSVFRELSIQSTFPRTIEKTRVHADTLAQQPPNIGEKDNVRDAVKALYAYCLGQPSSPVKAQESVRPNMHLEDKELQLHALLRINQELNAIDTVRDSLSTALKQAESQLRSGSETGFKRALETLHSMFINRSERDKLASSESDTDSTLRKAELNLPSPFILVCEEAWTVFKECFMDGLKFFALIGRAILHTGLLVGRKLGVMQTHQSGRDVTESQEAETLKWVKAGYAPDEKPLAAKIQSLALLLAATQSGLALQHASKETQSLRELCNALRGSDFATRLPVFKTIESRAGASADTPATDCIFQEIARIFDQRLHMLRGDDSPAS